MEGCLKIIQNMASETSLIKAYNALQSSTVRASLNIPGEICFKLEPEIKEKINAIKAEIRKKRAEKKADDTPLPPQYSTAALMNTMLANLCVENVDDNGSDVSTDDDALHNVYHTQVIRDENTTDLEVRANLEHIANYSGSVEAYAIADSGADSCVVGANAEVISYTGRYATLVGYDPKSTRSKRIPIVTAYLKIMAHNGIPVLLKVNEAVYIEGSPVTLLSEYQI